MKDPLLQALHYVSRFYGLANAPEALITDLPLSNGLLTPFLLPRAAEKAGLQAREEQMPLEQVSPLLFPVIALLRSGDACVVLGIDQQTQQAEVVLSQSDGSEQWLKLSELQAQYSGHLFLIKKRFRYDERSPEVLKTREGHWFWSTLWESRSIYRDVLVASVLINLFAIATPMFSRLVYDKIVPNLAFDSLWVLASGITVVFGFDLVLKLMRSYFIDVAGKKSDLLISAKIFAKVMGIRLEAKPPSVGAFARHLQEFESIREFFTSATISSLIDLPFALLFLLVIYMLAGPLVLVPLLAVILLCLYSLLIQKPLARSIEEGSRLASQKHANLVESLAGLETVKMFGAQSQFQYRWEEAVSHMSTWAIKSRKITDSVQNTAGFLQQFVSVAMIVFGVYLIAAGELTMGGLIAASMLSGRAVGPLVQLSLLSTRYNQAKSAMTILERLMAMPSEQEEGKRYIHRPVLKGKIEFDNVSFNYPGSDRAAVSNINLCIEPGEKVAIIGRIGSGKTTLERLLLGLFQPQQGSIRLDDTEISQINPMNVRRNIGCVPQDVTLFFGSIRDNIALGRPQVSDAEVLSAASRAGVTGFTQQDPAGLERQIGEGGQQLSGGQRQAIAIARAFLGNPQVLVLDEPTSSMDNRSELYIKRQLQSLSASQTLVLITHKMGMLNVVDRLIVMEKGKIIADGPRDEVLERLRKGE
ncbi:MAG: type I secretion system permease/ATPase [Shewanella algae]|uniref:type I secretion system permease/ATPase n=1 Tax=Shewanella algae TaxID=38313 RepID=UPI0011A2FB19|nr:type I secretion system permease/ATPase [Shewanella algae]MBO2552874.1 type I secretion system permease/ATPase [Shewanella algae]MBO2557111.1 type I secretion system permease/ATPase [Shewanella algae]MBO2574045.1 type I secretion system permease/ATPase [Shewanella algae]MBO2582771.1 type I secretion system permease/ATPase [Shewanella algae]MBO2591326.1 type I secretion system permease/ATPase [Shewanella algae]